MIDDDRWLPVQLLCYDIINEVVLWKKEFSIGSFQNYDIVDIDNDGIKEIILSSYSPMNQHPIDELRREYLGSKNFSTLFILNNLGEIKSFNDEPLIVSSSFGFCFYEFLYLPKKNQILLGLKSYFDNSEKKLQILDLKTNQISTLNILYNDLLKLKKDNDDIILLNRVNNRFEKIRLNSNLKVENRISKIMESDFYYYDNNVSKLYGQNISSIGYPYAVLNNELEIIYQPSFHFTSPSWKNNDLFCISKNEVTSNLLKLHFERNKTLNPYLFIIILTELLIILLYFFVYHHIKIPMISGTSSYFILYSFFGRLYYWKLQGRLKRIYKLPKKMSVNEETPINILNEISDDNELRYQRDFFFLKYKVFEISSIDEFQIIQRISHDLKNQVLMTKLMTEQYEKSLKIKNKDFVENMFSSLKDISSSAVMLSNFSHINKLYKEKVEIKSFIESIISQYVNHPLFEKICHSVKSRTQSEEFSQRQTNEESTTEKSSFGREARRASQEDRSFFVNIDKSLFQIAFKNLLNNALEAINKNGYVKVETSEIKDDVVIELRNSFDKLDSSCKPESGLSTDKIQEVGFSTKEKGSGLGIPISKAIIERHKGTLDISLKENEFIVRIILAAKDTKESRRKT